MPTPERLGEALDGVPYEPTDESALAAPTIPPLDVLAREEQDAGKAEEHDDTRRRQLDEPPGARNGRNADDEQADEHDEIERAVEDDGAEGLAPGHSRVEPEPASAQEVSDAPREHVVDGDSAHRHLVEAREPDLRGRRDPAPARGLERVDDGERSDRKSDEASVRLAKRVPDGIEVRVADGEPEEEEPDRDADERDDGAETPGRHRAPNLPVPAVATSPGRRVPPLSSAAVALPGWIARTASVLAIAASALFALAAAFAAAVMPYRLWDSLAFGSWSRSIAETGDLWANADALKVSRPLFYVPQGLIWRVADEEWLGRTFSAAFGAVLVICVWFLARRLTDERSSKALLPPLAVLAVLSSSVFATFVAAGNDRRSRWPPQPRRRHSCSGRICPRGSPSRSLR